MAKNKRWIFKGFIILNNHGEPWTPHVFKTEGQAKEHLKDFWKDELDEASFSIIEKEFKAI